MAGILVLSSNFVFTTIVILSVFYNVSAQKRYTYDVKIRYYTDASLICDHPDLNLTQSDTIKSLTWVFPDGTAVDPSTTLNPDIFQFSGPGSDLNVTGKPDVFRAYNLTVLKVDDDVFGYYTCVVVYTDKTPLTVIRWGLNVNGADFSELIEEFKENAVIGGIAAAAMLVLVGGSCLVWHFRFSNRNGDESDDEDDEINDVASKNKHVFTNEVYTNNAYNEVGVDQIEMDVQNSGKD